jgi:hypothetical protein
MATEVLVSEISSGDGKAAVIRGHNGQIKSHLAAALPDPATWGLSPILIEHSVGDLVSYVKSANQFVPNSIGAIGTCVVHSAAGQRQWSGLNLLDDINAVRHEIFQFACENLPATVNFGPGTYKIVGGMTIELPIRTKGLAVQGIKEHTRFEFVGDFDYEDAQMPSQATTCSTGATIHTGKTDWFALRIRQSSTPAAEADYLENISLIDMVAADPQPWLHATTEETHGFNIAHTRTAYCNCHIDQMGDEGIEFDYCVDFVIDTPKIRRVNFAAEGGGSGISVKNGCKRGVLLAPVVVDNLPDEWVAGTYALAQRTLLNGQVYKSAIAGNTDTPPTNWTAINPINKGIGIKVITADPVEDITIIAPVVKRVHDAFIIVEAAGAGAKGIKVIGGSGTTSLRNGVASTGTGGDVDDLDIDFAMSDVADAVWSLSSPGNGAKLKSTAKNVLVDHPSTKIANIALANRYEVQGSYKNFGGQIFQFNLNLKCGIKFAYFENCGSGDDTAIDSFTNSHKGFYVEDAEFVDCRAKITNGNFITYVDSVKRVKLGLSISNGGSTKPWRAMNQCIDVHDVETENAGIGWSTGVATGKPPSWTKLDINFNISLNGTSEAPVRFVPSAEIIGARLQGITVNNSVVIGGKNVVLGANTTKTWLTDLSTLNCATPGFTDSGVTTLLANNQ